jgi:hypothetical protein
MDRCEQYANVGQWRLAGCFGILEVIGARFRPPSKKGHDDLSGCLFPVRHCAQEKLEQSQLAFRESDFNAAENFKLVAGYAQSYPDCAFQHEERIIAGLLLRDQIVLIQWGPRGKLNQYRASYPL